MEFERVIAYIRRFKPDYEYEMNHFQLISDCGHDYLKWNIKDLKEPTIEQLMKVSYDELNEYVKMKKCFCHLAVVEDLKYIVCAEEGALVICNKKLHYFDGKEWIQL